MISPNQINLNASQNQNIIPQNLATMNSVRSTSGLNNDNKYRIAGMGHDQFFIST